jgi:hypothetical protein
MVRGFLSVGEGGGKRPGPHVDHSPPLGVEDKNEWSYISMLSICLQGDNINNFTFTLTVSLIISKTMEVMGKYVGHKW